MGWRYVAFRSKHEVLIRSGLFKNKFPVNPVFKKFISLENWKSMKVRFFFEDKESIQLAKNPNQELEKKYIDFLSGKYEFFSGTFFDLNKNYDWVTNPQTGFVYDSKKHWTEIADYSVEAGDIKYVWEKSRFSYLYNIIRHDYHFNHDNSDIVFKEILSWIEHNPDQLRS